MRHILLATTLFIGMSNIAFAEPLQLVQYAAVPVHQSVDINPEGRSIGDLRSRQGAFRATVDGPDIGEYFAQATVVAVNEAEKQTVWSQVIESVYPNGSIYKMDIIVSDHEISGVGGGFNHEGAIIGGTGKYAGIRGSYEFEVLKGGVYKITNTYWLGQ